MTPGRGARARLIVVDDGVARFAGRFAGGRSLRSRGSGQTRGTGRTESAVRDAGCVPEAGRGIARRGGGAVWPALT